MRARVEREIASPARRWYPGLARELADLCWSSLADFGLDRATYSTLGALHCRPPGACDTVMLEDAGWDRPLRIEPFDQGLAAHWSRLGLRAAPALDRTEISSRLAEAMALLGRIPSVAEAVRSLVWAVVPVDVEGPAYDTGYSDPAIPFSIFIGIHPPGDAVPAIRLAEGILHEAMHLQLSLIEDVLPMIAGRTELRVSPWQHRPRPMQGLLHGLYVFRVIQDWYAALLDCGALDASEEAQARKRLAEIEDECATLRGLAGSPDLTGHGRQLAASLAAGPSILQSSGA